MNPKHIHQTVVNEDGSLVLPARLVEKFGLRPGVQVDLEEGLNELHLLRPVSQIAKVYVEVTNACNLDCVTCMRNIWDEPLGKMTRATFDRVLEGISQINPAPTVFFGGIGEPLAHAHIAEMVQQVKALGATVELISNGILLTEEKALALIRAGLDTLWVSLDGASPDSYSDVRLGASFNTVIANLRWLRAIRYKAGYNHDHIPILGIAFVAMQRNIGDLPEVLRLGASLGAKRFSISNVLAHTQELKEEILYERALDNHATWKDTQQPIVNLPRLDTNALTQVPLAEINARKYVLQLAGKPVNRAIDTCPFIEQGSLAIRWDGSISPCLPLLHSNESFFGKYMRNTQAHSFGSLQNSDLSEIWNQPDYRAFRERVRRFDFSPCTSCTGCELSTTNQEDCLGSPAPTCGGCLWGQGLILCP